MTHSSTLIPLIHFVVCFCNGSIRRYLFASAITTEPVVAPQSTRLTTRTQAYGVKLARVASVSVGLERKKDRGTVRLIHRQELNH